MCVCFVFGDRGECYDSALARMIFAERTTSLRVEALTFEILFAHLKTVEKKKKKYESCDQKKSSEYNLYENKN